MKLMLDTHTCIALIKRKPVNALQNSTNIGSATLASLP